MAQTKSQPKNWQRATLGEYLDFYNGKSIKPSDHGMFPVYGANGKIGFSDESLYEESVIIGRVGAYCGAVQYEHGKFWASDNTIVAKTKENGLERFAYYLLHYLNLNNYAGGSAQPLVTQTLLKQIQVIVPTAGKQKDVANILSTYDDLIENNTRRIQILEQMTQVIYQEAFASTNGKSVPLGEAIKIHRGKSYGSHELSETDGVPFVNLKCIDRDGGFRKSGLKRFTGKYKDTHKVVAGDIVMAVTDMTQDRRIVARAARIPTLEGGFGVISMDLVKIEPKEGNDKDYIYSLLRWSDFADEVKNYANGANVLHLIPDRITDYKTYIAPMDQQKEFGKKVGPLLGLIDKLELQNESLRQSRDLLLPKLVTGEIRV